MLFRVDEDAAEDRNLLVEQPLIFSGMALETRHELQTAQTRGLVGEAVEITPEAEEALRALGYLN